MYVNSASCVPCVGNCRLFYHEFPGGWRGSQVLRNLVCWVHWEVRHVIKQHSANCCLVTESLYAAWSVTTVSTSTCLLVCDWTDISSWQCRKFCSMVSSTACVAWCEAVVTHKTVYLVWTYLVTMKLCTRTVSQKSSRL